MALKLPRLLRAPALFRKRRPRAVSPEDLSTATSVWTLYRERFQRHRLGRVGLGILLLLYSVALFAGFLSPATMTWTDKQKPYHPPTNLRLMEPREEGARFRPFVYEQAQVNVAFREYAIVPPRSLRIVAVPHSSRVPEFRAIDWSEDPDERVSAVLEPFRNRFRLGPETAASRQLGGILRELAAAAGTDDIHRSVELSLGVGSGREARWTIWVVRGNKNYVQLLPRYLPYRFWSIADVRRHLLGSPTGGLFLIGTDALGRDVLSRLIYGSRVSLTVGLLGVAVSFVIGVMVGGIAGYAGGTVDSLLMRLVEVTQSIPTIYLLFALRAVFPPSLSSVQVYLLIVLILSLTAWSSLARIIRGMVLSIKSEEYVLAARSLGVGHLGIIVRHILPNTMSLIIVQASLTVPGYILGESALSLLGLGITEPQSSWGLMLAAARNFRVISQFPWILVPGFFIFVAILAWNFFGDGIRDALDPRSVIR